MTPSGGCLKGITRKKIIQALEEHPDHLPVIQRDIGAEIYYYKHIKYELLSLIIFVSFSRLENSETKLRNKTKLSNRGFISENKIRVKQN